MTNKMTNKSNLKYTLTNFNSRKIGVVVAGGFVIGSIFAWIHGGSKDNFTSLPNVEDILNDIGVETCLDEAMSEDLIAKVNELQKHLNIIEVLPSDIKPSSEKTDSIKYVVQSGDTLSELAVKYDTTVEKLKKDNNLESDVIIINQELIILPSIEKIIEQYNNFDKLKYEEKNVLLDQILYIRKNSLNYIKDNATDVLLELSMDNVKCKVLDAYNLTVERYHHVIINSENDVYKNDVSDILISPFDINKNGEKNSELVNLDGDLECLQSYIYGLQSKPIAKNDELTKKDLKRIYNILNLNFNVMQKNSVFNDNLLIEDSISLQKRK